MDIIFFSPNWNFFALNLMYVSQETNSGKEKGRFDKNKNIMVLLFIEFFHFVDKLIC